MTKWVTNWQNRTCGQRYLHIHVSIDRYIYIYSFEKRSSEDGAPYIDRARLQSHFSWPKNVPGCCPCLHGPGRAPFPFYLGIVFLLYMMVFFDRQKFKRGLSHEMDDTSCIVHIIPTLVCVFIGQKDVNSIVLSSVTVGTHI
jgi:hypothetical protein